MVSEIFLRVGNSKFIKLEFRAQNKLYDKFVSHGMGYIGFTGLDWKFIPHVEHFLGDDVFDALWSENRALVSPLIKVGR